LLGEEVLHNIRTLSHCLQASAATASVIRSTYGDLYMYLTLKLQKTHNYIHNHVSCSMLITKNSRLLQIIAFYDFVSVVYRQFISFDTKMEVVARITSSRLVFTSVYWIFGTESISWSRRTRVHDPNGTQYLVLYMA